MSLTPCPLPTLEALKLPCSWVVDERLSLHLVEEGMAEAFFELIKRNTSHLAPWLPWVSLVKSLEDERKALRIMEQEWGKRSALHLGIYYDGVLVGACSLHEINKATATGYIGYWLDARLEGQGVMRRSCKSICQVAFDLLALERLIIRCAIDNLPSQRVALGLGFVCAGVQSQQAGYTYMLERPLAP